MDDIKVLFSQVTDLIFNEVSNKLDENASVVDGKLNEMYQSVRTLESKIVDIVKDVSELKDEFSNYQRVSIVSNLNNQIRGKDRELIQLRKQLEKSTENVQYRVTADEKGIPAVAVSWDFFDDEGCDCDECRDSSNEEYICDDCLEDLNE